MEVKPGFKQTELGVLPLDWKVIQVSDIATSVASGISRVRSEFGDFPVHGSTGIIGRCIRGDYSGSAILIARVGANAGRLNVVNGEYGVTDNTIILRVAGQSHLGYVWRQLEAKRLNSIVFGSGQPLLTGTQIKNLSLPFPPTIAEQEAIAGALSETDALIESLEQLIAKKRQFKQGTMHELLTGKRRLPSFSGEWQTKPLRDLVDCCSSGTYGTEYASIGAVPMHVATTAQISDEDRWNGKKMPTRFFTPRQLNEYGVATGDLVIVKSSGSAASIKSGKIGLVDESLAGTFLFSNFLMRLRPLLIHSQFLYFFLTSNAVKSLLPSLVEASTYPNIRINEYLEIIVPLPTSVEQEAIAGVLLDSDAEIRVIETKLDKARQVKQGMMQELLTGRIRLI